MGGEIVQHERRRQNEAPGERQRPRRCARAPAARLVADREPLDLDVQHIGVALRGFLQVAPCFALEKVVHAPVEMFAPAGDTENPLAAVTCFGPRRAALAGAMHDPVGDAAQRNDRAVVERGRLRQPSEARRDPAAVALRKVLGLRERSPWRHGQDRFAIARMDSQRIAASAAMAAQAHRIDLRTMLDEKPGGFSGTSIKKCAGHFSKSGGGGSARTLP